MSKRTQCQSCGRTTHTYHGSCTACGKTKPAYVPVKIVEHGLTDNEWKEIAGLGIVFVMLAALCFAIAMVVVTFG